MKFKDFKKLNREEQHRKFEQYKKERMWRKHWDMHTPEALFQRRLMALTEVLLKWQHLLESRK